VIFLCSCYLDLDRMTFIYELDPYFIKEYTRRLEMNFLRQDYRKLSYYIQTDIHTAFETITTPLRGS